MPLGSGKHKYCGNNEPDSSDGPGNNCREKTQDESSLGVATRSPGQLQAGVCQLRVGSYCQ